MPSASDRANYAQSIPFAALRRVIHNEQISRQISGAEGGGEGRGFRPSYLASMDVGYDTTR